MLNNLSNTVVLAKPPDDNFILKWQLACKGNIAHVVVMQNVSRGKIDQFVSELAEVRAAAAAAGTNVDVCVRCDIGPCCSCSKCSSGSA